MGLRQGHRVRAGNSDPDQRDSRFSSGRHRPNADPAFPNRRAKIEAKGRRIRYDPVSSSVDPLVTHWDSLGLFKILWPWFKTSSQWEPIPVEAAKQIC